MNQEALEALRGSIAKWRKIVEGTGIDEGSNNCPLCQIFNNQNLQHNPGCRGCPVFEKTKSAGCGETPYDEWSNYYAHLVNDRETFAKGRLAIAQKELDFLISLLPEGETP